MTLITLAYHKGFEIELYETASIVRCGDFVIEFPTITEAIEFIDNKDINQLPDDIKELIEYGFLNNPFDKCNW